MIDTFGAPLSLAEIRLWRSVFLADRSRHKAKFGQGGFGLRGGSGGSSISASEEFADGLESGGEANALPWLYPPSSFQQLDKYGTLALPAIAATPSSIGGVPGALNQASNMPWNVPQGFNGFLKTLAIEFVANGGAAWTPGVLVGGVPPLQFQLLVNGHPATDYGNICYSPGAINAPTSFAGVPIKEGNLVEILVLNNSIVVTTQFVHGRVQGYYYPKSLEPKDMWQ